MRKKLWLDVDDVLVETSPLTEASLRALTGKTIPISSWPHHHFAEIYGLDAQGVDAMCQAWMSERVLERAPLRAGVPEALNRLAEADFELGIITARGWHPYGREITEDMVATHRLPVSEIVVMDFEESKAEVLAALGARVDGMVDDTARHVRGFLERGVKAFIMSHSWNQRHDFPFRVDSICEFADHFAPPASRPAKKRAP